MVPVSQIRSHARIMQCQLNQLIMVLWVPIKAECVSNFDTQAESCQQREARLRYLS